MNAHTGKVCSKAFFVLNKISQIRKFLSDGCHQNTGSCIRHDSRVTCHLSRYSHITPALLQLHWFLVASRIRFKIVLLVYKTLKGSYPSYTTELLHIKPPGRHALRNDDQHLLLVQRTKWESLPLSIRNSANVDSFSK